MINCQLYKKKIHTRWPLSVLIAAFLMTPVVYAQTLELTAVFKPDPSSVDSKEFKNTTPVTGYCQKFPVQCERYGLSSFKFDPKLEALGTIKALHENPQEGAMVKAPAEYRDVIVTSQQGEVAVVKVRIEGVGGRHRYSKKVCSIVGMPQQGGQKCHQALWGGVDWISPPKPCAYAGSGGGIGEAAYEFFWKTPVSQACEKRASFDIDNFRFDAMNFSYQLINPNPLYMKTGVYEGSITYTIGPNQDFDFGALLPSDPELTLKFTLRVEHVLQVKFPPGAEILSLNPEGGWQQWLLRGRRPEKISANQNFEISASTPLSLKIFCQYVIDGQCGIKNSKSHLVPVETRITLPTGFVDSSNLQVRRFLLRQSDPVIFSQKKYVYNQRGTLDFEIGRERVKEMTNYSGTRYSGTVNLVFDAEIK